MGAPGGALGGMSENQHFWGVDFFEICMLSSGKFFYTNPFDPRA